jgi:hypothetical protein
MSKGIRIKPEHSSNFGNICDALEAVGIEYSIWNAEAMLLPDYDGPIDLNCDDPSRYREFANIVKSFTAFQTAQGT